MTFCEPLLERSLRIFEGYGAEQLQAMLDFLERGREMVEQELAGLERQRGLGGRR